MATKKTTKHGALAKFAKLLNERMEETEVSVGRLVNLTGLTAETIRNYMLGTNAPTKDAMRRLTRIFGKELREPFEGIELTGPDPKPIDAIELPDGRTVLITHVMMPNAVYRQTRDLWDPHHVTDEGEPVYPSSAKR